MSTPGTRSDAAQRLAYSIVIGSISFVMGALAALPWHGRAELIVWSTVTAALAIVFGVLYPAGEN